MAKKSKANKKKGRKEPHYTLDQVLTALEGGEATTIGIKADMGDEKSLAVIAQYVHYLHHPKDPERARLLRECYGIYRKSIVRIG